MERSKLHALIKRQFGLDEEMTDELVAEATAAEHEAIDLYHFTQLINRSLEEDGRRRVVEMMWEMVYADGHVSEFERNLIWRAAESPRRFVASGSSSASRWPAGKGPASARTRSSRTSRGKFNRELRVQKGALEL